MEDHVLSLVVHMYIHCSVVKFCFHIGCHSVERAYPPLVSTASIQRCRCPVLFPVDLRQVQLQQLAVVSRCSFVPEHVDVRELTIPYYY